MIALFASPQKVAWHDYGDEGWRLGFWVAIWADKTRETSCLIADEAGEMRWVPLENVRAVLEGSILVQPLR